MSESTDPHVARLEVEVEHLKQQVTEMSAKLDQVLRTLSEAKGGWRTLMAIGGAAAAVGGAVAWAIQHVRLQ